MPHVVQEGAERSLAVLHSAATPHGFVASPAFDHYAVIWARDALISSLGAVRSGDPELIAAAAATLDTLAGRMSPLGQVPAVVAPARNVWDFAEGGVVDATAWLPIVVGEWLDATGDRDRARTWWGAVARCLGWLAHQDVTGTGLLSVAPSTDWMDAALTRSGRTLHINALHAWAVRAASVLADALGEAFEPPIPDVGRRVDAWFWPDPDVEVSGLFDHGFMHAALVEQYAALATRPRDHYVSHIVHAAFIDVIDVLANCVTVLAGVASPGRAATVLRALAPAADPWPSRTLPHPIERGDRGGMLLESVDDVIDPRWRNSPGRYHNGAAWPFVGGFHAAAAATALGHDAGVRILERVAGANELGGWRFSEWIGANGPDGAPNQTWNAGTYLYAWSMLQ